ncbi:TBC1 domain family member 10A-like [Anguilla rostrata]|uniref:TBC1 domain family member 10A-like n=1 Tax=Anguilla rostrata TaxID=7938 RepID=UPI0030D31ADD
MLTAMARIQGNGVQAVDARSFRGTTESLANPEDTSFGSESEVNGFAAPERETDKYGFIGGAQQSSSESAEDVPPEVLRQREVKWLDMLNHWDKWMAKRHKKVKLRCQKGIPPSLRGRAWLYLSGGKVKREQNQGKFQELDSQAGDPKWVDVIERDLHRQFPFHEMFMARGGYGQKDLFSDAFWGLVQICEKYLPGYYSAGLEAIQLDGEILFALLRRVSPLAYRHLKKHKMDPILYMTEWFMCAFSRTLPWASVLRVWDMFLCEGVKIIFRVGLVLLKCMLGSQEKLKKCPGQYETMELLRAIQPRYMQESFLVREVLELTVSERDIEKEHHAQLRRWKETHGELRCKSPPRMHGARAIMVAEPPSRQDLKQKPTIVVDSPLAPSSSSRPGGRGAGAGQEEDAARGRGRPTGKEGPANPNLLPSDPRPLVKDTPLHGSAQSVSSTEHDTYL